MKFSQKHFTFYLSSFLLGSSFLTCHAAESLLPDAGLLMRENRLPAPPPKKQVEPVIEKLETAKPAMLPENALRLTVQAFHLSGNTQFADSELVPLLAAYVGHEIGFSDLEAAAKIITGYYHQAGFFLASAYIPQQTIKHGQVEITILEGRLDASHLTHDAVDPIGELRINHAVLQRFIDSYTEGEIMTVNKLNHLSLLINDLPGIKSKIVLTQGSQAGSSALKLKVREEPLLKGYVQTDNHGLYATGYYRMETGLTLNDVTGWGDQLNMRVQSTETGRSVLGSADYNLPINGYGTRLAVNFSELHYSLGRSFRPLSAVGIARTVGISLNHPLWLAREGRLMGTAHYEHRWMQDNIGLYQTHNHRELNVLSFSFAGNYYDQLLPAGGITQGSLTISAGEVRFANQAAYKADQTSGLNSNGGYHKIAWQLNRSQNITEDFSLFANFQGQVASKNLDSSEQISLGGANAIRAYPVGEGSADEGWMFNGEARYHLPSIPSVPGYMQLVGFIDTGFSRINANPLAGDLHNSRHLTGYGVGLNLLEAEGFNVHTSVAWHAPHKYPTSDSNARLPMVYFQLSKSF